MIRTLRSDIMKVLPVEKAIGMVLGHDLTEIIPGECKHAAFKKGHIIKKEDIPRLLKMGKENVYIMELNEGELHEDEAAIKMAKAGAGEGIKLTDPSEGKVNLIAEHSGLLKVNFNALAEINSIDQIVFATLHTDQVIKEDTLIAGTKVIPLVVNEEKINLVARICEENFPIVCVKPFKKLKVGIVTTGNEVFYKRIEDKFGPVIRKKFSKLGCTVLDHLFSIDDSDMIANCIKALIEKGVDIITVTGGMSVDPDDVTPLGIKKSGANIISYGAPTMPGAMFLLSYIGDIPVVGLPGCVMYNATTIFDLVIPRLVAGERVEKKDIVSFGHGGLCRGCQECVFPNCGFGK